jgi:ABC-2 type transport system permease protein
VTAGELSQLIAEAPAVHRGGSGAAIMAIMQHELMSLFFSPIAYIVGTLFLVLAGFAFVSWTLVPGNEASMRTLLEWLARGMVLAIPLLTMRSLADEFASGAIETLMTAPVTDTTVVLGKFLGSFAFYLVLLAATGLHLVLMAYYADPVSTVVISGYFGMVLLGAFFIAVGIFASSCTRHQLLAAALGMVILSLFTFAANQGTLHMPTWGRVDWKKVCSYVDAYGHFSDFAKGSLDLASVVFFLSGTVLFLFLAVKVLESRRWR